MCISAVHDLVCLHVVTKQGLPDFLFSLLPQCVEDITALRAFTPVGGFLGAFQQRMFDRSSPG